MKEKYSIMWFRRDLRLYDNHALHAALSGSYPVIPIFIFDNDILEKLPKDDHRVTFIYEQIILINNVLREKYQTHLQVFFGKPQDIFSKLLNIYSIESVYVNNDYEPYAKRRDKEIQIFLEKNDIQFKSFKDQVIFEKSEIVKKDGQPYIVYTPYMKAWKRTLIDQKDILGYNTDIQNYCKVLEPHMLSLADIGFKKSTIQAPKINIGKKVIDSYIDTRDIPSLEEGTTHIGTALRFGIISIRELVKKAISSDYETYLNELIWREFFMQILWHFPHSATRSFREKYDFIQWRNNEDDFEKWKQGQTGYPLVDAGMRELNHTGYMHNRVRMVVASFLCKHLLIDWRWGEQYFAEKLFDYEMSSNVGNWQWVAGSGVDAAPYFRVFNPEIQFKKFDPNGDYVRKWVPEYFNFGYVNPMVEHQYARERALETYKSALKNNNI